MPHFQLTAPGRRPSRHPISRHLTSIGSSSECHLVLPGPDVLPTHATLMHEPGRFMLESAQRAAVLFVRGNKTRSHELRHGDVVVSGNCELPLSAIDDAPTRGPSDPKPQTIDAVQAHQLDAVKRLVEFSELLLRPGDLEHLLSELIDQVVALTREHMGFLVLADDLGNYQIRVARNLERQPVDDPAELLSDNIIREVITSRQAQIISDAYSDTRFQSSLSVINLELRSVMCVPLIVRGEMLGLIYVGNNDFRDLFKAEQLEMLKLFAAQAALFIKNAGLLVELREESAELAERLEEFKFGEINRSCPQMIDVYNRVEKVAGTDITVLIPGETGTGKELPANVPAANVNLGFNGYADAIVRPEPLVRRWTLGAETRVDLCNDNAAAQNGKLEPGLHSLRIIVTDRPWYREFERDDDGEVLLDEDDRPLRVPIEEASIGVPDLPGGATYAIADYVFRCGFGRDPEANCNCLESGG